MLNLDSLVSPATKAVRKFLGKCPANRKFPDENLTVNLIVKLSIKVVAKDCLLIYAVYVANRKIST